MARANAKASETAAESTKADTAPTSEVAPTSRRRGRGNATQEAAVTTAADDGSERVVEATPEAIGAVPEAASSKTARNIGRGKKAARGAKVEVVRHGRDEMNLVEYPFASLWKNTEPGTEILHEWETQHPVTGRSLNAFWRVTGDPKLGLPTPSDEQVYLALMELTEESGLRSPSVHFTRHDLLRRLNWPVDQHYYNLLRDAFTRLGAVFITSQNAFWDAKARSFKTIGFNLIDNFEILEERRGRKRKEKDSDDVPLQPSLPISFFKWNDVLFESFQAGYIRAIDLDFALSLRSSIALRLYRYLDKKSYDGRQQFEVELSVLCERHLGMKPCRYPSKFKERLAPAHEELLARGFLGAVRYEPMSTRKAEKVCYTFASRRLEATPGAVPAAPFENWEDDSEDANEPDPDVSQLNAAEDNASASSTSATSGGSEPQREATASGLVQVLVGARIGDAASTSARSGKAARAEAHASLLEGGWSDEERAVLRRMLDLKVAREVARELAEAFEAGELRDQLDCLDDRAPKDPAAVFVKATREGWELPRAFVERREAEERARQAPAVAAAEREAQRQAREAHEAQERARLAREADEAARLEKLWESLSEAEHARVEAQARGRLGVLGAAGRAPAALEAMRRTILRAMLAEE